MASEFQPTILVVNDDPIQLQMAAGMLERDGMRVVRCTGAEEALMTLGTGGRVDAIVTDLHMPGIDGWRFCRLLRSPEYAAFNQIPILITSATFSGTDAEEVTVGLGANAFLPMPYEATTLRSCVRELLRGEVYEVAPRVLIVASPTTATRELMATFEAHSCCAWLAGTYEEALRCFQAEAPDMVVLDYDLQGLADHQLLRRVKALGSSSVAVILTNDPSPTKAVESMRHGADGYVRKPYGAEYVMTLCEKAKRERAFLRVGELLERRTENLRDSESRFRSLIEGIVEIILVCDSQGAIQHINEVGAQRLEWTPQELMGKPLTTILMEGTGPAGPSADLCRQSVYCTRTGHRIDAEETLRTIVFDGRPAVMRVARDMTERRRAEEEKTSLEEQLRQVQKMDAVGTLAGGVAHDFNNLLTVILCHVHLMKMRTKPGEELYQDVATIETVVHRANSLTEQLLGFARRGKYQNTVVDVRSTIREVMGFLSRTLDKKIVLREECTTEEAVVLGDPGQLHQVILNLSVNARDAMPEGGALTFRTEVVEASDAIRKRVTGAVAERYVIVSVSDTGSGISEEVRGRIFEPFFTTKEPGKGTGMGLAMVYGIMQNHSGFVEVGTAVGQGTTFTLYLPQAKQAVRTQEPAREEAPVRGSGKVLLVDDEELVRNVAARLLKHLGYEVEMASDGQDAADYYREHWREITLVILDMIMPRMNGRECFHALQAINPEVKAILITGYDKNHGAQGILDEGVQGFVQKPFELNQFSRAIDQAIQAEPKPGLARST